MLEIEFVNTLVPFHFGLKVQRYIDMTAHTITKATFHFLIFKPDSHKQMTCNNNMRRSHLLQTHTVHM